MAESTRATLYLDRDVFRAAKVKAAVSGKPLSRLVNESLRRSLQEDAQDLAAFDARAGQPRRAYEDVLKSLKRAGRI